MEYSSAVCLERVVGPGQRRQTLAMLPNFAFHTCLQPSIFSQQINQVPLPAYAPKLIPTRDLPGFATD